MKPENENETAEVAPSAASESRNPTAEVKSESDTNFIEAGGDGKPGDGEVAQPGVQVQTQGEEASLPDVSPAGSPPDRQVDEAPSAPTAPVPEGGGETPDSVMDAPVRTISKNIVEIPVDELKPHPLNKAIYGSDLDDAFVQEIAKNGVYQPLLITKDKTIIAGHRRHAAAKQGGLSAVPTLVFHSDDELDIKAALVEANKQRAKTNEQIGREFNVLKEVEEARAKKRMEAGQAVAQGDKGKARDKVAAKIGDISGFSAERAGAVVKVIEKLGDGDFWATRYRTLLRKISPPRMTRQSLSAISRRRVRRKPQKRRPLAKRRPPTPEGPRYRVNGR
jgi:ParB-like chromosome segregation protein Spo0J